jgi:hypothetical protein
LLKNQTVEKMKEEHVRLNRLQINKSTISNAKGENSSDMRQKQGGLRPKISCLLDWWP